MSDSPDISKAIICLGSNVPTRISNIEAAIDALRPFCDIIDQTAPYEFPDVSGLGEPYVNVVLSCSTNVPIRHFRDVLKRLELQFGRDASSKQTGIMPLDIDLVIWQDEVIDDYEYTRPYFRKGYEQLLSQHPSQLMHN